MGNLYFNSVYFDNKIYSNAIEIDLVHGKLSFTKFIKEQKFSELVYLFYKLYFTGNYNYFTEAFIFIFQNLKTIPEDILKPLKLFSGFTSNVFRNLERPEILYNIINSFPDTLRNRITTSRWMTKKFSCLGRERK